MTARPFHAAITVDDLETTRDFYARVLGCRIGRSDQAWVDFDFFGHQLSCHAGAGAAGAKQRSAVDGDAVPVPHFGVVLPFDEWEALAARLRGQVAFLIGPRIRFQGRPGEQGTFFIRDPSGNVLEFKGFRDPASLFASQ